jgi:hypothetical protein
MGASRGQLVDGALVLAQVMSPSTEIAQEFARRIDLESGDEKAKVKTLVFWLNMGLQLNAWPGQTEAQ